MKIAASLLATLFFYFLCTLLVKGQTGGVGPPPQKIAFHPIPIQTYAALDISGTSTVFGGQDNGACSIDIDDDNQAGFASLSGTAGLPGLPGNSISFLGNWFLNISGEDIDNPPGILHAFRWSNGALSADMQTNLSMAPSLPEGNGYSYNFDCSFAGDVDANAISYGGSYYGFNAGGFQNDSVSGQLSFPETLYNGNINDVKLPGFVVYSDPTISFVGFANVSSHGSYIAAFNGYVLSSDPNDPGQFFWSSQLFTESNGNFTWFVSGTSPQTTANGLTIVPIAFAPYVINNVGSTIGYDGSGNAAFWQSGGTALTYLSPMESISALNDQNQVVGSTGTNAYLWTQRGGATLISALLPVPFQSEVANINPLDISGTDADGNVRIVFNAQYQTDADAGPPPTLNQASPGWSSGNFVLTVKSGTMNDLRLAVPPSSTNLTINSVNANGISCGIGNITMTDTNGVTTTGTSHALLLLPVEVKVVNRDDPTQTWADGPQIATGPIYSGDSDGDMVSFKIIGTDTWSGATFSWSASGPESITGPSGVGVNTWKIEDENGNDPSYYTWLGWTPGEYTITCTVTFSNGDTSQLQFKQEIAQRTEQYFIAGTIPVETENTTGVLPRIVSQWECPDIFYALGAAVGGGVNSTASSLYIPMDATDRVYVNNRILNATRNLDLTQDLQPDQPLSAACGLDPHKDYRFFSACEFKFRVQNNTLASAPQVVLDGTADFVGFTPVPCSQSDAAGVIGQQSPDSGKVTGNPGDTEVTYLSKNRAGNAAQTGWANINGRTLPWVFFRFRFEAGEDGLLHTKFSAGPSSDPNGPDNNHDYSYVPTILVYRRYYNIQSNQWELESVQTLNEQRRPFMSIGTPVSGAPFIMP